MFPFFSISYLFGKTAHFLIGRDVFCFEEHFTSSLQIGTLILYYYFCAVSNWYHYFEFCVIFEIELLFRPLEINFATLYRFLPVFPTTSNVCGRNMTKLLRTKVFAIFVGIYVKFSVQKYNMFLHKSITCSSRNIRNLRSLGLRSIFFNFACRLN